MEENELKVISELSKNSSASQRELSQKTDLSLGAINIILRRLVMKGFMKTIQLDGRKMQYIVTPKGFSEKIKKTTNYIFKTINTVNLIEQYVKKMIADFYKDGCRTIIFAGNGELLRITTVAVAGLSYADLKFQAVDSIDKIDNPRAVIFYTGGQFKKNYFNGYKSIDISEELAQII